MRTVKHFTQHEIEEILRLHVGSNDRPDWPAVKRTAKIVVELEGYNTGDPRDPPGTRVRAIRAEVTEES
jgi:hypothetical protein